MINFSLNTCWRLIPTEKKTEVIDFQQLPFLLITFLITFCLILAFHATIHHHFTQPYLVSIGDLIIINNLSGFCRIQCFCLPLHRHLMLYVIMNILISIRPNFCHLIYNGKKIYEYRKKIFTHSNVDKVYIYATKPICKIIGCFTPDIYLA